MTGIKHKLKGPVRATRRPLVHSRQHTYLDREVEERLFASVDVLAEGTMRDTDTTYFGSVMITFDLQCLGDGLRGAWSTEQIADLFEGSVRCRLRASRLATEEIWRRFPHREFGTAQVETRVTVHGDFLHVDLDVEIPALSLSVQSSP